MVQLTDIHSLTGFLRDHKAHLERLAATGRPEVLTVNGKARVVVQDAASYQSSPSTPVNSTLTRLTCALISSRLAS